MVERAYFMLKYGLGTCIASHSEEPELKKTEIKKQKSDHDE